MVVNSVTLTPKVPEINGVKINKEIDNEKVTPDRISISSKAREIQQERSEAKELARKIIATTPDIRQEKVYEAITRLNNYSTHKEEIMDTLAERMAKMIGVG